MNQICFEKFTKPLMLKVYKNIDVKNISKNIVWYDKIVFQLLIQFVNDFTNNVVFIYL